MVAPSNERLATRFVARDANTTYRPVESIMGLKLSPLPALTPSAESETNCVGIPPVQVDSDEHVGLQNTCLVTPLSGAEVTRFVAVEVKAIFAAELSTVGSKLGPLAAVPSGAVLNCVIKGWQVAELPRQVFRRKMSLEEPMLPATKFVEVEANATDCPLVFVEGPAVVNDGIPFAQVVPQTPLFASLPSGATSTRTGRPADFVGFTGKGRVFEAPPPGAALNT